MDLVFEQSTFLVNPEMAHNPPHTTTTGPRDLVDVYLGKLREEFHSTLDQSSEYREQLSTVQKELAVYKRAFDDLQLEKDKLGELKANTEKRCEELEKNQIKANRVVALIDGDGAIFDTTLIRQGQTGGHDAAKMLADHIKSHLFSTAGASDFQLWVYVFLNKRGLSDTLGRHGEIVARNKFEDFIIGFNQAAERFMMVDVGNAKEAADAKIKAILENELRMPQTMKVLFGGCHDNGYVTSLRSHITAGFKDKIILLPGYTEVANGISDLDIPLLTIPDLFVPEKFAPVGMAATNMAVSTAWATVPMKKGATLPEKAAVTPQKKEVIQESTFPSGSPDPETNRSSPRFPLAWARVSPRQRSTSPPGLDWGGSSESSEDADEILPGPPVPAIHKGTRHINPKLALTKQNPPPCTLFYLANCRHGTDCKYGHDYILNSEHYAEIQENAKKAPCPTTNKGELCTWGDNCCYGHKCPQTTKCFYLNLGRCRFIGSDMHKD